MIDKRLIKEVEEHIWNMLLDIYKKMWYKTQWKTCNITLSEDSVFMKTLNDIKESGKNEPITEIKLK